MRGGHRPGSGKKTVNGALRLRYVAALTTWPALTPSSLASIILPALKGPRSRFPPFPLEDCRKVVVCGGSRDDSLSAEADVRRERSTRLERWSDVSKVTRSDVCSGRSLVFVDDAAEDVAAGDGCLVDRRAREGTGDRRGELQATMRSRLVVVADVLIEDRFEMSP